VEAGAMVSTVDAALHNETEYWFTNKSNTSETANDDFMTYKFWTTNKTLYTQHFALACPQIRALINLLVE
jgi:hypothetical protein